jgi:ABC-type xylose transport system permease subunit
MINNWNILTLGDIFSILAVTIIGFATHGELDTSFITRMSALFFPLLIAWFLLSPWLGLFQAEITSNPKQLWRPALAMLFAAPLAAVLRGFILNTPIIPIFVIVLAATSTFGMLLWRGIYFLLNRKVR